MVQKFEFWFSPAGENRRIHLYLPDDYGRTEERYPVVYMFDGHNLFFDSDATFGKSLGLKEFLDRWHKKLIVVGIECSKQDLQRVHEYCPYHIRSAIYGEIQGRGDETVAWIVHALKPYIDRTYRTYPFREATAIAGYSMGGMMALFAVLRYNNWFSKAAVISPSAGRRRPSPGGRRAVPAAGFPAGRHVQGQQAEPAVLRRHVPVCPYKLCQLFVCPGGRDLRRVLHAPPGGGRMGTGTLHHPVRVPGRGKNLSGPAPRQRVCG